MNRLARLKLFAVALMIAATVFYLFWMGSALIWFFDYFADQSAWLGEEAVTATHITWLPWVLMILIDAGTAFFSTHLYVAGLLFCIAIFRNRLFSKFCFRTLIYLGLSFAAVGLWEQLYDIPALAVLTWHNPEGQVYGTWWYSPIRINLMLAGFMIALLGFVMNEARLIEEENKAFV